jgi:peptidoglycan/LPS O-acetylase OafA/YrhL
MSSLPEPRPADRLLFVDGLRGIAALAVVAFHSYAYFVPTRVAEYSGPLPYWLEYIPYHGWLGVEMFFAISGFVIAYSVRGRRVTPGFFGNFALRRSIRLDPPYWVVIAAEVLLVFTLGLAWDHNAHAVDFGQIGAHLIYAQEFLGYEHVVGVFWTLCAEVQLYVAFMVLLGVAQWVVGWRGEPLRGPRLAAFLAVFAPLAVWSLVLLGGGATSLVALADRWFYIFLLGALAAWSHEGLVPRWCFFLYAVPVGVLLVLGWSPMAFVALATSGLIFLASRLGKLQTWLGFRWVQYLGAISYSLYLVHLVVGDRVLGYGVDRTGMGPLSVTLWTVAGLASSFLAAHLLHRWVEVPSVGLSRRLKRAPAPAPVAPPTPACAPAVPVAAVAARSSR